MEQEAIFRYVDEKYDTRPEYLWTKHPHYAVLRHQRSHKWYALIMDVPTEQLGLPAGETENIMDVKLEPEMVDLLQLSKGFLPAYHMNKSHWITVRLNQVDSEQIRNLIDASYQLTGK